MLNGNVFTGSSCVRMSVRMLSSFTKHDVVVTGLGVVSPLGVGTQLSWSRLCDGVSTATALTSEKFDKMYPGYRAFQFVQRSERTNIFYRFEKLIEIFNPQY